MSLLSNVRWTVYRSFASHLRCCYDCYRNQQHRALTPRRPPLAALLHSIMPSQLLVTWLWLDAQWLWLVHPLLSMIWWLLPRCPASVAGAPPPAVNYCHFAASFHSVVLCSVAILAVSLPRLFLSRQRYSGAACAAQPFVESWIFMSKWWRMIIGTRRGWNGFPLMIVSIATTHAAAAVAHKVCYISVFVIIFNVHIVILYLWPLTTKFVIEDFGAKTKKK